MGAFIGDAVPEAAARRLQAALAADAEVGR
jgi:hypothetical protein